MSYFKWHLLLVVCGQIPYLQDVIRGTQISGVLLTTLALAFVVSCGNSKKENMETVTYWVNSYRVPCVGVAPMQCLEIRRPYRYGFDHSRQVPGSFFTRKSTGLTTNQATCTASGSGRKSWTPQKSRPTPAPSNTAWFRLKKRFRIPNFALTIFGCFNKWRGVK